MRPPSKKPSKEELENMYVKGELPIRVIGNILKMSPTSVYNLFREYKIKMRGFNSKNHPWRKGYK